MYIESNAGVQNWLYFPGRNAISSSSSESEDDITIGTWAKTCTSTFNLHRVRFDCLLKQNYQFLIIYGANFDVAGNWTVIWWPVVSEILVSKIIKIW